MQLCPTFPNNKVTDTFYYYAGISDWRVPTVGDMAAFSVSGALTPGALYAYRRDDGKYKRYQAGTDFADFGAPNADQNTLLRPMAEVSVNKE